MNQVVGHPFFRVCIITKKILGDDFPLPVIVEFDLDLIDDIYQPPEKGEQYQNVKECNFAFLLQHGTSLCSFSKAKRELLLCPARKLLKTALF
jgi:hypothetical protein